MRQIVESEGSSNDEVIAVLKKLENQAKENEKFRAMNEMRIHDRLANLQFEMKQMLAACRTNCMSLLRSHNEANQLMSKNISELTIPLHERVEDYVKGLQQSLEDAERWPAHHVPVFAVRVRQIRRIECGSPPGSTARRVINP